MHTAKKSSGKASSPRRTGRKRETSKTRERPSASSAWNLRLYVAGRSPKSETALSNLRRLCESHIPGRYSIEVVDLLTNPHLAKADQILAIPTLVRKIPTPIKRIIGDLSNSERAIVALDFQKTTT